MPSSCKISYFALCIAPLMYCLIICALLSILAAADAMRHETGSNPLALLQAHRAPPPASEHPTIRLHSPGCCQRRFHHQAGFCTVPGHRTSDVLPQHACPPLPIESEVFCSLVAAC